MGTVPTPVIAKQIDWSPKRPRSKSSAKKRRSVGRTASISAARTWRPRYRGLGSKGREANDCHLQSSGGENAFANAAAIAGSAKHHRTTLPLASCGCGEFSRAAFLKISRFETTKLTLCVIASQTTNWDSSCVMMPSRIVVAFADQSTNPF